MANRVIDKTIILVVCSILYALLIKKSIDSIMVIAFLFAIIFWGLSEIFQGEKTIWCIAFISTGLSTKWPEFVLANILTMYSLLNVEAVSDFIWNIDKKKTPGQQSVAKWKVFAITGAIFVIQGVISTIIQMMNFGKAGIAYTVSMILVMVIASVRTIRYNYLLKLYYEKYDELRLDAFNARKERSQAFKQSEENVYMATLGERNRIAREIHDNVGHMLTRAIVQMQAIKIINKDENTKPYLESVDETINQAMLNIRKSVHALHDDSLDLAVMLGEVVKAVPESFKSELKTSIESATSTELKNAIVGIVREAVTNISKYSKGDYVKVEVIEHAAFWRVYVFDNGKNEKKEYLDASTKNGGGIGIQNIYDRAKRFNGNVNISSDENGFKVLVSIPKKS